MQVGFLLHLYQPPYQNPSVLKKVFTSSYEPLITFIEKNPNFKVTLNIPLSLLELLERYGYSNLIARIKKLYLNEHIELVGSAAYHPILSLIENKSVIYDQISLNESSLGSFFGTKSTYEGTEATLIKDINGFFPPEMAISDTVINILDDMNYKWVIVDSVAVNNINNNKTDYNTYLHGIENKKIQIINRNTKLSNLIAFNRDSDASYYIKHVNNSHIVALDAETFGHHNRYGIAYLKDMLLQFKNKNIECVSVNEFVSNSKRKSILQSITESTWSTTLESIHNGNIYTFWNDKNNSIQQLQWQILHLIQKDIYTSFNDLKNNKKYYNNNKLPMFILNMYKNDIISHGTLNKVLLSKVFNSDQFWWLTHQSNKSQIVSFDKTFVDHSLLLYTDIHSLVHDTIVSNKLSKQVSTLHSMLL